MFTITQIEELKAHFEKAQNPLFYYDNDADGLCSFLILRRALGKGKGVAVRSYPDLDAGYAKKAKELNADYVFVLDKPVLSKEFVEELDQIGIPLVWIDHHDVENTLGEFSNFYIYNPSKNQGKYKSHEPVTYLTYQLTKRKEDLWIAIIGCVADHYMPDFAGEFAEKYPQFWGKNIKEPFDVYFNTEIGKIGRAFNFGLKDSVTHVVQMQNFLIDCKSPEDVFSELNTNHNFRKKYLEVRSKYDSLIERAKNCIFGKMIFFEYSGELSISSDLSNELAYKYRDKFILVAYKKGSIANISIRGKNVKSILEKVLLGLTDARGGGHEDAVGARVKIEDLEKFKELFLKEI